MLPCLVEPVTGKQYCRAEYIPKEEGFHAIDVNYDGNPVLGSPFTIEAILPPDPSKVRILFNG